MGAAVLSDEQWAEVEKLAIAGMSYPEIAKHFPPVTANAIGQRAWEKEWMTPNKVLKLKEKLRAEQAQNVSESKDSPKAVDIAANTLAGIGEELALVVARGAGSLLKKTFDPQNPLLDAPKTWKETGAAFGILAKATGLDRPQTAVQVNVWGGAGVAESEGWVDAIETGGQNEGD